MATDYREKEREFLDSLETDTGRDLAGWMAAITGTGLNDRNAIIDWLRQRGFLFARASWLERIHHNGGRPIYGDAGPTGRERPSSAPTRALPAVPASATAALPSPLQPHHAVDAPETASVAPLPAAPARQALSAPAAPQNHELDRLLAEAKAYRPLAQFVLREIASVVPDTSVRPETGYVALSTTALYAILTISPRELRLGLVSPTATPGQPFTPARFPKSHAHVPAGVTHMAVLDDARQVTAALVAAVGAAAALAR